MILIETNHFDIEGPRRLEYLLERIKPKTIAIEFSKNFSSDGIEKHVSGWRDIYSKAIKSYKFETPLLKELFLDLFSVYGYDALIPILYGKRTGAQIFPIDAPREKQSKFLRKRFGDFVKGLMDEVNPEARTLLSEARNYSDIREQLVKELDKEFYHGLFLPDERDEAESGVVRNTKEREHYMAKEFMNINPDLLICCRSLVPEPPSNNPELRPLVELWGDMAVERITLCNAFEHRRESGK